jgi:hypothetical protein
VKVARPALELVPAAASLALQATAEDGKLVLDGRDLGPPAPADGVPLRAVAVLDRSGEGLGCPRISAALALRALAPSSLVQLRGGDRRDLDHLAAAVGGIACYRLAATDLPHAVAALGRLAGGAHL